MILDGKALSEKRLEALKDRIIESKCYPTLATVIVGDDPASKLYVRMKHRACDRTGIGSVGIELKEGATTEEIISEIEKLNDNPDINGILVQLPLPAGADTDSVIRSVSPFKDVDGFHPLNLGSLFSGEPVYSPCTPKGVMTILEEYNIKTEGAHAVVIGRSIEVGRPMAALLLNADATVTICHSRTKDLAAEMIRADILVSAVGRPGFVHADMVKEGATVIDVGTNYDDDGRLCGDVCFNEVSRIAGAITPVPGGVGPMTIATLMENTFMAAGLQGCTRVK